MIYHVLAWMFFISGFVLHYLADKRGGSSVNRVFWATMGFYFGPIAIPLLLFSQKKAR